MISGKWHISYKILSSIYLIKCLFLRDNILVLSPIKYFNSEDKMGHRNKDNEH